MTGASRAATGREGVAEAKGGATQVGVEAEKCTCSFYLLLLCLHTPKKRIFVYACEVYRLDVHRMFVLVYNAYACVRLEQLRRVYKKERKETLRRRWSKRKERLEGGAHGGGFCFLFIWFCCFFLIFVCACVCVCE